MSNIYQTSSANLNESSHPMQRS